MHRACCHSQAMCHLLSRFTRNVLLLYGQPTTVFERQRGDPRLHHAVIQASQCMVLQASVKADLGCHGHIYSLPMRMNETALCADLCWSHQMQL